MSEVPATGRDGPDPLTSPELPIEETVREMRALGFDGPRTRGIILERVEARIRGLGGPIARAVMAWFVERLDAAIADAGADDRPSPAGGQRPRG
jgi:hypothetical protein